MVYDFDFGVVWKYRNVLLKGAVITCEISVVTIALGTLFGLILANCRLSENTILHKLTGAYVEFFRCTPSLVQLTWIYFVLPMILAIELGSFTLAVIALTLNVAAFYGETFRAGIQAIPSEQVDAAKALGLSRYQRFRYIILPQAFRIIIPVLISTGVSMFKESSLISTVGVADLMHTGRVLSTQTYRPIEILTAVALIYFVIAYPITVISRKLEKKLQEKIER